MLRQKKKISSQNTWNKSKNISRCSSILHVCDSFCVSPFWTGAFEHSQNQEKNIPWEKNFSKWSCLEDDLFLTDCKLFTLLVWIIFRVGAWDMSEIVKFFRGKNGFPLFEQVESCWLLWCWSFLDWILRMFGKEENICWRKFVFGKNFMTFSKNSEDLDLISWSFSLEMHILSIFGVANFLIRCLSGSEADTKSL